MNIHISEIGNIEDTNNVKFQVLPFLIDRPPPGVTG